VDGGEDEIADLRRVDDVAEEQALLGLLVDAAVQPRVGGRGDDEEAIVEVAALEAPFEELDRQRSELGLDLRRDDGDAGAAVDEPARLPRAVRAAASERASKKK
jgi:hypothetical protein